MRNFWIDIYLLAAALTAGSAIRAEPVVLDGERDKGISGGGTLLVKLDDTLRLRTPKPAPIVNAVPPPTSNIGGQTDAAEASMTAGGDAMKKIFVLLKERKAQKDIETRRVEADKRMGANVPKLQRPLMSAQKKNITEVKHSQTTQAQVKPERVVQSRPASAQSTNSEPSVAEVNNQYAFLVLKNCKVAAGEKILIARGNAYVATVVVRKVHGNGFAVADITMRKDEPKVGDLAFLGR